VSFLVKKFMHLNVHYFRRYQQ